jgi:two-component system CheB/CheR fusion protein
MVASAGGLDGFKKFFAAMPADSGIAFVVIPHLDPKHESLMVELLARQTSMPVVEATEGMAVEANRVYILPPNKYMTIAGGVLHLTGPVERSGLQTSIDLFLRSLADDQMEKAVCIILSGTGAHGTLGLKAVKAAGGMAMVQDPLTAEYPRMPQSALATGLADYVLAPEKMPEALLKYVQHFYVNGDKPAAVVAEGPDDLNQLLALLRARTEFDFRCYRKKMLTRRVERRMGLNHFQDLDEYTAHLRAHPEEVKQLACDLFISVTSFFRDPDAFRALEAEALVPLIRAKDGDASLRVWVPSCATGEEAYSLAILLLENMAAAQKSFRVQIFATDVDEDALEAARQGVYPESIAADVSPERLARYFTRIDESSYQINKQVRELLVFAPQNVIADAPFSKMDLVSCRNLLIYLDQDVQRKILNLFHFSLNEDGYLFLGPSETIGRQTDLFEPVSKKWRIFRRIGPTRPERVEFPISTAREPRGSVLRPLEPPPRHSVNFAELTQRLVLEEIGPAAVLINRKYEVLYFLGPTSRYLEMPAGEPTQDLLRMLREGLASKLRGAIHKVVHDGKAVHLTDVQVRRNGGYVPIAVSVRPLQTPKAAEGLLLVVFRDAEPHGRQPLQPRKAAPESSLAQQLEYELRATKEDLQSTIEEMESSNEELKASNEEVMSMNEELQAANEELETSKEELQSLNEEMSTVNNQLSEKVDALEAATNDMANLLNCTDVATVFLDTSLRIRRFTSATTQMLNLIATDVDRPLSDIAPKFADADLTTEAESVLRQLTPVQKEIQTADGRWWLRRILPYRTSDNRIEGVVLTFHDVTGVKQADTHARLLATILINSSDAVIVHDFEGRITTWNRGAERLYGYTEAEALRMNIKRLIPQDLLAETSAAWARLQRGERVDRWETRRITKDGRMLNVMSTATPLTDDSGWPVGVAKCDWDITDLAKARAGLEQEVKGSTTALREQEERLRAIVDHAPDGIIAFDERGILQSVNPTAERLLGYAAAEMIGQSVSLVMPTPNHQEQHDMARFVRLLEQDVTGKSQEVQARHKDGTIIPVELAISHVGHLGLFTAMLRDIRHRQQLEREIVEIATLEQQRIGQNLHDDCGQELAALGVLADGLSESLEKTAPASVGVARKMVQGVGRLLRQIRNIARGLAQAQVEPDELSQALAELTSRLDEGSGVHCVFQGDDDLRVADSLQATHLFHIAQEACTNALKHAQAKNVEVQLRSADHALMLQVRDDGTGLAHDARENLGQRIMRNRASVIGAELTIGPGQPRGTMVTCTLTRGHPA